MPDARARRAKKRAWGTLNGAWVPHDVRDDVVDYVRRWSERAELAVTLLVRWIGVGTSKFYQWRQRYGKANEHNAAGRLDRNWLKPTKKGTGFMQPLEAHDHWHVDVSYVNIAGTFYYLCSLLDGFSRYLVHWELRESMTELEVETIVQRGLEKFPDARPRIISDNGPQFIARDFKGPTFGRCPIRIAGITHVRTSPYYPQSNGKLERWHASLKRERPRPAAPSSIEKCE